jgi:Protein of unknown function (DUF1501)
MHFPCQSLPQTARWNRRDWLLRTGHGMGAAALAGLIGEAQARGEGASAGMAGLPHFAAKAKRVIFLFMSGGTSQFEMFDHKPMLNQRQGEDLPASLRNGKELLGMSKHQTSFRLVGSAFKFQQHGQSGAAVSELFPETAKMVDDLCFVRSMLSDAVNHDPALTFLQTGAPLPARPCMGSWIDYGLGSVNQDLPGFIVMVSKRPADQPLSSRLWDSGFLPTQHQGVQFRAGNEPVLYLANPAGVSGEAAKRMIERLRDLHLMQQQLNPAATEIDARIAQFEMAGRMQTAVPEATDIKDEPEHVLKLYGEDVKTPGSFARNCLLARRFAERGVRFVQLYHPGWDHHGGLPEAMRVQAQEVDRASAALIQDLKQRDLLKDTLVVFGSEFGRTCYSQGGVTKATGVYGREHHRDCFTFWMAGGGIKPGVSYGETDEFGYQVTKDPVHVNDFHATFLHLLGIDHLRFTYPSQGRDFRLTDVGGKVIKSILA